MPLLNPYMYGMEETKDEEDLLQNSDILMVIEYQNLPSSFFFCILWHHSYKSIVSPEWVNNWRDSVPGPKTC